MPRIVLYYTPISIHSLRGEGDLLLPPTLLTSSKISIHSLRGEGDGVSWVRSGHLSAISIHSLRGEGDVATGTELLPPPRNFNPLPPWGGRLYKLQIRRTNS